jgi:predicted aspartyl protease
VTDPYRTATIVALLGWLILISAGIWRRGEPIGRLAKQAAIWIAIIGLLWVAAAFALSLHR